MYCAAGACIDSLHCQALWGAGVRWALVGGIIAVDLGGRQGWWGGNDDPARGTKEMEAKAVPCPLKYYCPTGNFQPRSKL